MVWMSVSCADRNELCTNAGRPYHRDHVLNILVLCKHLKFWIKLNSKSLFDLIPHQSNYAKFSNTYLNVIRKGLHLGKKMWLPLALLLTMVLTLDSPNRIFFCKVYQNS